MIFTFLDNFFHVRFLNFLIIFMIFPHFVYFLMWFLCFAYFLMIFDIFGLFSTFDFSTFHLFSDDFPPKGSIHSHAFYSFPFFFVFFNTHFTHFPKCGMLFY